MYFQSEKSEFEKSAFRKDEMRTFYCRHTFNKNCFVIVNTLRNVEVRLSGLTIDA